MVLYQYITVLVKTDSAVKHFMLIVVRKLYESFKDHFNVRNILFLITSLKGFIRLFR